MIKFKLLLIKGIADLFFRFLPWIIICILLVILFFKGFFSILPRVEKEVITHSTIIEQVQEMGRIELVKYNFKEVLDYQKISNSKTWRTAVLRTGNYDTDMKAILIASGEAAGCIDLMKIKNDHIQLFGDTLIITLPQPELCYHKLDLENTRLHTLTREGWWSRLFTDEKEDRTMIEEAYRNAEKQIKIAALSSGILEETKTNAEKILRPFLEEVSGRVVIMRYDIPEQPLFHLD